MLGYPICSEETIALEPVLACTYTQRFTTIQSDTDRSVHVRIGHDDWFRLWVNAEEVYSGEELNGFQTREVGINLKEGDNPAPIGSPS